MLGFLLIPLIGFGLFAGVPLAIWAAMGCPHSDD